jgi:hypothetical protein
MERIHGLQPQQKKKKTTPIMYKTMENTPRLK